MGAGRAQRTTPSTGERESTPLAREARTSADPDGQDLPRSGMRMMQGTKYLLAGIPWAVIRQQDALRSGQIMTGLPEISECSMGIAMMSTLFAAKDP